jgi:hypothetical protein
MCERCRRISPFDTYEKMDAYLNQCFAYGQDLGRRKLPAEEAALNAFEFCETFQPPTIEGRIGVGFVQAGWEHPEDEPLSKTDKGYLISRILVSSGHIVEVMEMMMRSADRASRESETPDPDETIH